MLRKLVKVGDLVRGHTTDARFGEASSLDTGIVIEIIDHISVPPCARILWQDGSIGKEWTDEILPAVDRMVVK